MSDPEALPPVFLIRSPRRPQQHWTEDNSAKVRLSAIEYMIADLFKKIYEMNDVPLKKVKKDHEFLRKYLQKMTLQIPDPALSDLTAGEMMDAFERLMEKIEMAVRR